ncbi:MAG: hypothetical protein LKH25_04765 [Companilactobacillus sp.]|uniref:hypothetical protein n=2 Tax=Companilactobacillus sp. TaxID=2767905 RepID=UPI0025C1049B|nr:hypothetical protein [Companilactobacillus sp.]MCH4077284.1 hypothetical protein [Companilactobacillus sp.]MCI1383708.1 hypothetical protein [Companilactobacillus sp.]MCI1468257.1 hypothetical protein [Companilactobacillus sp.]
MMKKTFGFGLLFLALFALITSLLIPKAHATTTEPTVGPSEQIVIGNSDESDSTSVPVYRFKDGQIKKTKNNQSTITSTKKRLAIFTANRTKIDNQTFWKIGNNKFIDNNRVNVIHGHDIPMNYHGLKDPVTIYITASNKDNSTSVPVYKLQQGEMIQTNRTKSMINKDKSRLAEFSADRTKYYHDTYWKIGDNEYLNNDRIAISKQ